MNEFKEILNNNLDSYELYKKLNNKDDYIIFHLNIVKYVLDREGINYKVKPYSKYMLAPIELNAEIIFNLRIINIYCSRYNKIIIFNHLGYFLNINKETTYENLKKHLLQRIEE